jgi:hypothetical protein
MGRGRDRLFVMLMPSMKHPSRPVFVSGLALMKMLNDSLLRLPIDRDFSLLPLRTVTRQSLHAILRAGR